MLLIFASFVPYTNVMVIKHGKNKVEATILNQKLVFYQIFFSGSSFLEKDV